MQAAEKGAGFYLLGSKGTLAGVLPPTGVYLQNDFYLLDASIGASQRLPIAGNLAVGVDATAALELPTVLWATPWEVLGGRPAFSATVPVGYQAIDARVTLGPLRGRVDDDVFTVGDPVVGATMGWSAGDFHWTVGTLLNVPIGDYQEDELANIAFHRWAGDVSGALTWFDPTIGTEASVIAGVTFNGENPVTDYVTGTEFHLEASLTKFVTPVFSIGPAGYFYQQVSPDSGAGARLGDFEGRVAALGMRAAYSFEVGETPVTASFKIFREFEAENRPTSTAGYFTVAFPLAH